MECVGWDTVLRMGTSERAGNTVAKYRMYVDEVGNSDLKSSRDPNHRYLSLTGVIIELGYVDEVVFPRIEDLKRRYFGSHPDEPIILHRKELVNAAPPFNCLQDPDTKREFDAELLAMLDELVYTVVTVVIDKQVHVERYKTWQADPYHYCMMILLERYVMWLEKHEEVGDVLAESRGGKEDKRLKDSFSRLLERGSEYMGADRMAKHLTSHQLKVKPKASNISGLQIADLIAHPAFKAACTSQHRDKLPENFGGKIARILETGKFDRSPSGGVQGWGRKWLP